MSKITERRKMYAQILTSKGIDLTKSWYSQPQWKMDIVGETCRLFKFKSSNPSRVDREQFYYSAQAGFRALSK